MALSKNILQGLGIEEMNRTLYKQPTPDKGKEKPTTQAYTPDSVQQIDLLFLPEDQGFKYALVLVDLGSKLSDAEPIKDKQPATVIKALDTIYGRKILKPPKVMESDPGSEFKGVFHEEMTKRNILHSYGKAGRHRQQATVESRNSIIGKALFERMSAIETITGQTNREWVKVLPKLIKLMNDNARKMPKKKAVSSDKQPVVTKENKQMLPEGTKVRIQLDNPEDIVHGSRLHGRFRASDIRWSPDVHVISQTILKPDQPPMYMVSLNGKKLPVAYTRNQLQLVSGKDEPDAKKLDISDKQSDFQVKKILDKKIVNGKAQYLVRWYGYKDEKDQSWEPENNLPKTLLAKFNAKT